MKKILVLLAMVLAFTVTSVAQYGSSSTSGQSDQTTSSKKSKKSGDQAAATSDTGGKTGKSGKAKKEATLTGCLGAQPDASGNYSLTNGKYKKGVEVTPADKVKAHAGHQVQLTGQWAGEATPGGGTKSASSKGKTFEVASLKHISETCKEAPGGGTAGETKKGKKDKEKGKDTGATPPKQ